MFCRGWPPVNMRRSFGLQETIGEASYVFGQFWTFVPGDWEFRIDQSAKLLLIICMLWYVYVVCVTQLVSRQMIDLYRCSSRISHIKEGLPFNIENQSWFFYNASNFIETPATWYRAIYFSRLRDNIVTLTILLWCSRFWCHRIYLLLTRTSSTAPGGQDGEGSSRRTLPKSGRRRPCSAYKRKRPANLDDYTCDMALYIVVRKVEIAKANNNCDVLKYKANTDIVKSINPTLPWLTSNKGIMLRNHIDKLHKVKMKGDAARPPDEDVIAATANNDGESSSTFSALTLSTKGNRDTLSGTPKRGLLLADVLKVAL